MRRARGDCLLAFDELGGGGWGEGGELSGGRKGKREKSEVKNWSEY